MKITSIIQQKNNKNKYSIFIDNVFFFSLDYIDIVNYKLKENINLDEKIYNNILNKTILNKATNVTLKYLSYKMRTKKEVLDKLKSLEYPLNIINNVINSLLHYKYLDDYNYANLYIKEKSKTKVFSKTKIKYNLKLKGIDEKIINEILENCNINEEENIIKLINKKLKNNNKEINIKEKNRIYNFLRQRGFSSEDINTAFRKVF